MDFNIKKTSKYGYLDMKFIKGLLTYKIEDDNCLEIKCTSWEYLFDRIKENKNLDKIELLFIDVDRGVHDIELFCKFIKENIPSLKILAITQNYSFEKNKQSTFEDIYVKLNLQILVMSDMQSNIKYYSVNKEKYNMTEIMDYLDRDGDDVYICTYGDVPTKINKGMLLYSLNTLADQYYDSDEDNFSYEYEYHYLRIYQEK